MTVSISLPMKLSSTQIALVSVFSALQALLTLFPFTLTIGTSGQITLGAVGGPLLGILLGPLVGHRCPCGFTHRPLRESSWSIVRSIHGDSSILGGCGCWVCKA